MPDWSDLMKPRDFTDNILPDTQPEGETPKELIVAIALPQVHHDMLKELTATGMYSRSTPCTACKGDEDVVGCHECKDAKFFFEESLAATAEVLVRNALCKMVETGGYGRLIEASKL